MTSLNWPIVGQLPEALNAKYEGYLSRNIRLKKS
jgi:hypothetical protein